MSWLTNLFTKIENFFNSPAAKAAEQTIETLIPIAAPIVAQIDAIAPNKTMDEIEAAYTQFAIPFSSALATASPGAALQQLATAVLQKEHAPTAALSLLNTVVELAVQAVKLGTVKAAA